MAWRSYRGRVVIDWGPGSAASAGREPGQASHRDRRPVRARFPGFREFVLRVDGVPTLPNGRQQVLRSAKGVYLLVDVDPGQQYVGSAKGADSLLGRWLEYSAGGNGGDVGLKAAAKGGPRNYKVSMLEAVGKYIPDQTIEQLKSYWKIELFSRRFGLNRNCTGG